MTLPSGERSETTRPVRYLDLAAGRAM